MKCLNKHPKAIRAAAEFAERLQEVHGDKISLSPDAVYVRASAPIDVVCNVCGHEWSPRVAGLVRANPTGCPECCKQRKRDKAGKSRSKRWSEAIKELARQMRHTGMSYKSIADCIGASEFAVTGWINPEQKKRWAESGKKGHARRAESGEHSAKCAGNTHRRRLIKYEQGYAYIPDHPDANGAGWVEFDMSELYLQNEGDLIECAGAYDETVRLAEHRHHMQKLTGMAYEIDHLVPLEAGGAHHPANLCIRTSESNRRKNNSRYVKDEELFCKRLFNIN